MLGIKLNVRRPLTLCDQLSTRNQQASQQQQLIADALVAQDVA